MQVDHHLALPHTNGDLPYASAKAPRPGAHHAARSEARAKVLSLWLVWTTEKDNPSGFPSSDTEVSTFISCMHTWHPHLLMTAGCTDSKILERWVRDDWLP